MEYRLVTFKYGKAISTSYHPTINKAQSAGLLWMADETSRPDPMEPLRRIRSYKPRGGNTFEIQVV